MNRFSYKKNPYYYHFFSFVLICYSIRTFQWYDYEPDSLAYILKHTFFDTLTSLFLTVLFIRIALWAVARKSLLSKLILFILVSLLYPTVYLILTNSMKTLAGLDLHTTLSLQGIRSVTYRNLLMMLTLNGMFFWTYYRIRFLEQTEISHQAESLAKDARLLMLRYQINPHFLFNILNSLYALVDENREQARDLIIRLSEYYRSTLKNKEAQVPIAEELDIIRQYLDIQKIRYDELLQTSIEVDDTVLDWKIPSFVLLLLVENAIKYTSRGPDNCMSITVQIGREGNNLIMSVTNPGKLKKSSHSISGLPNGTSSGLENIRKRIALYYGEDSPCSLTEKEGSVTAQITIKRK